MAKSQKLDDAAIRHYEDAERLAATLCHDNAGHLIGFAAECAIKHVFGLGGATPAEYKHHLPTLASVALKRAQGRLGGQHPLFDLLRRTKSNFFSGWDVSHRYSATGTIDAATYRSWRIMAERTLNAASLKVTK